MEYTEHHCYVEPDIRLHYVDEGSGRTIVSAMGLSGSAQGFEYQIEYSRQSFRVIAVDPRNHGKSSWSPGGNTHARRGRDLGALMETLGLEHATLAGWSFGAYAVLNYPEQFGIKRVDAFVTIDNPVCAILEDEGELHAGNLDILRDFHFRYFQSEEGFRQFMIKNFTDGIFSLNPSQDEEDRNRVLNTCLRLPLGVGDQLIANGHLSDKRDVMETVDESIPCLFYMADYRKETGLRRVPRDYLNSEVTTSGNYTMFYGFSEASNHIMEDFLQRYHLVEQGACGLWERRRIGEETEWRK